MSSRHAFKFLVFTCAALSCLPLFGCTPGAQPMPDTAAWDNLAYVGAAACAGCHEEQTERWVDSDHALAMAVATEQTVRGDFRDASFMECGVRTTFFTEGGHFFVRTPGPSGSVETFKVSHTFGYRPLQQYLVEFHGGRLQALSIAWDTERERWFSLHEDECVSPEDVVHWTRPAMNWNYMCADCHSTNLERNFRLTDLTYRTTFSDINVSCEACHGPGEAHIAWARDQGFHTGGGSAVGEDRSQTRRQERRPVDADSTMGLTVRLGKDRPASLEIDTCAPCHSRRRISFPGFLPGKRFLDHYEPALLEAYLYYPDGQIQDEVFEYGSFLQSKMHAAGVRCSDCHDPHTTQPIARGNSLCATCHDPRQYDLPNHHHHERGSEGAQCVSCHMPARNYMVIDARRDHSFKVPRPDLTAEFGVPNACNGCHTDRTAEWATEVAAEWYGAPSAREADAARAFATGRAGGEGADAALGVISDDSTRPPIVRASALQLLGAYRTSISLEASRRALDDPHPLVNTIAVRNLGALEAAHDLTQRLARLLTSEGRLVRMEAARVLAGIPEFGTASAADDATATAFSSALSEYREGQRVLSDQPAAHLNLAVIHEAMDEPDLAEGSYRTAIRLDGGFVPAHVNLAMLYNRRRVDAERAGRTSYAERHFAATESSLRNAASLQPENAEVIYSLGLLVSEKADRLAEGADLLIRAAELDPENARVQFNAGLALQHLGRHAHAALYLKRASELEPNQAEFVKALSILYIQMERWEEALHVTEQLAHLLAGDPTVAQRLTYIRRRMDSDH